MSDPNDAPHTVLTQLRDARAPAATEQRIIDGAMGRAMAPKRRLFAPVFIAAATAAAAVWFVTRPAPVVDAPIPTPESVAMVSSQAPTSDPPRVSHHMTHGKGAVFQVEQPSPRQTEVQLTAGEASFQVDPLPPGGVFAVQTPHARVEVVGTAFKINVADGCSLVMVTEGRVRVRQGEAVHFVSAGEAHRACPSAVAGEGWVQSGLAHLVAGNTQAGVAELQRYVGAYPRGTLAEEALFHLALAAQRAGDTDALDAARMRYLKAFPKGARADQVRDL